MMIAAEPNVWPSEISVVIWRIRVAVHAYCLFVGVVANTLSLWLMIISANDACTSAANVRWYGRLRLVLLFGSLPVGLFGDSSL